MLGYLNLDPNRQEDNTSEIQETKPNENEIQKQTQVKTMGHADHWQPFLVFLALGGESL